MRWERYHKRFNGKNCVSCTHERKRFPWSDCVGCTYERKHLAGIDYVGSTYDRKWFPCIIVFFSSIVWITVFARSPVAHNLILPSVCAKRAYSWRFLGRVGRTPYRAHSLGDDSKCRRGKGLKIICIAPRCTSACIHYLAENCLSFPSAPCWVRHSYLSKRQQLTPYTCGSSRLFYGAVAEEWSAFGKWKLIRKRYYYVLKFIVTCYYGK